jgi:hypothetical protein
MARLLAVFALVALLAASCSSGGGDKYAADVDNAWFPLSPGTTYTYRGVKDGRQAREVLTVTDRTKKVDGGRARVLDDRLYLDGELAERTTDWYAQDDDGNVWYLGEETAELEDGKVVSTEGSWETGVDGAEAGIYMPADPKVGDSFRQEYYKGHAEDHFRVVSLKGDMLVTREWTPLEPDVVDFKTYKRGVGTVKERSADGAERLRLVSTSPS